MILIKMIKFKALNIIVGLSVALLSSQSSFAKTKQAAPEDMQQQKDQIKYKAYIPEKYVLFEAIPGDLNKDGVQDLVLIVKGTDPKQWVNHEYKGKLDRNRRGIIVLLNEQGIYKKLMQNLSAFSSENEDGGVYFAPELWIEIKKGLLNVHYGHGRYGYWNYSFRLHNQDLRLIGYDSSSNHGPYISSETSINFLTAKKVVRKNQNEDVDADPKFKETWSNIKIAPIYLSKIQDFDTLSFE